jgi:hypothetical protein
VRGTKSRRHADGSSSFPPRKRGPQADHQRSSNASEHKTSAGAGATAQTEWRHHHYRHALHRLATSHGAWREQVITRQPAAEKRFTVACPMLRLAPVKRSVRRCWLECEVGMGVNPHACREGKIVCGDPSAWARRRAHDFAHAERMSQRAPLPSLRGHPQSWDNPLSSRTEPRLAPGLTESCTAELDPIMQPEPPILPELHDQGQEAIAVQFGGLGTSHGFRSVERNRPLEGVAARAERTAGPGADLAAACCRAIVGKDAPCTPSRLLQPI